MYLGNCSFLRLIDRVNTKEIQGLDCPDANFSSTTTYTGTGQVYRAFHLGNDGAYYISQSLIFTILIRFWSIFFVAFSIIALSIKSFKLGKGK